ncbi:MAG TPA: hypothetical protein VGS22_19090 [Thermoanaerobaculia bacterium]|nr:hypothetical protein [Thermoanaerobaculia bacterium]
MPERSRWALTASMVDLWTPDLTIPMEGSDREVIYRIRLWTAAKTEARIRIADPGVKPPTELRLEAIPPLRRSASIEPEGSIACPVEADGRWRCSLPIVTRPLRLAIRGEGWVPIYRTDIQAAKDRTQDLGTLSLVRGGSLTGWVEVAGDRIAQGKCRARIEPFQTAGGGVQVAADLRASGVDTEVGPDGFFQFSALGSGVYRVEVTQPGFAAASAAPLEVWAGKETRLDKTLLLRRPLRLTIAVVPARDGFGQPWRVRVDRGADAGPALDASGHREGTTTEEGNFILHDAAPGSYAVEVSDSRGNRFYSEPDVVVEGIEEARIDVVLDLIDIRGAVSLGDEPLAATLWFGGRFGANRVEMSADREGKFAGVLPKAGNWQVLVSALEREIEAQVRVAIEPDTQGVAKVEIVLPDTLLGGRVVDPAGRAVPHADVSLWDANHDQRTVSGPDGSFQFRGVGVGLARLAALDRSTHRSSEEISINVREDDSAPPVVLRLRETRRLAGRVISPLGPVGGARVAVFPLRPVTAPGQDARSGPDGSFSIDVPKMTSSALAVVSPPGHALRVLEVPVGEVPTQISVGATAGTLEISWLVPGAAIEEGTELSVAVDGLPLPTSELAQWALGHGERFQTPTGIRVANLSPGSYRACLLPKSLTVLGNADPDRLSASCDEGYLAPGAELVLKPVPPSKERGTR